MRDIEDTVGPIDECDVDRRPLQHEDKKRYQAGYRLR